jgi:hypothetical protein
VPELTPEQRRLRAQIAAHTLHAKTTDPVGHTAAARAAFLGRFEREVDPDGVLPPTERARRAEHARRAYFLRLALRSSQARRAKRLSTPAVRRPAAATVDDVSDEMGGPDAA